MSEIGYRHPAWDAIEAAAIEGCRTPTSTRPGEHEIELSKAISLKRIADALHTGDGDTVVHVLYQIALNGIPRA